MTKVQITRATLLAAALVAAAPSPSQAQDRRPLQLLKIFMLLKGAPAQSLSGAREKPAGQAARTPVKPTVPRPERAALIATRGDSAGELPALPLAVDAPPLIR